MPASRSTTSLPPLPSPFPPQNYYFTGMRFRRTTQYTHARPPETMATTTTPTTTPAPLKVSVIDRAEDIVEAFECVRAAFGRQARDAIWTGLNPGWDTAAGAARGAARLVERWRGSADTVFLKATLPRADAEQGVVIAGFAIWVQASFVEGRGDEPELDLEALYPDDAAERRYLAQVYRSLVRRRGEVVREKAGGGEEEGLPAVMVLDLCATHPAFQRRGVASALVRWGLAEARRRGIREAVTEASSMGRLVYERLGFRREGPDIVYEVDEEFLPRERPSNVFMRTGNTL
ncbi:hypothetical protein F4775DRAFT_548050 [Biscogniauxia sp. FL1348]|nr:hypothetical protein F4775DRAFT_548050 [Biscogniauxia sp. FL1348]